MCPPRLIGVVKPHEADRMDNDFARGVEAIGWFSACGREPAVDLPFEAARVGSWSEAIKRCSEQSWEDATLEAQNHLTGFLCMNHRQKYQRWNAIAVEAKACVVTPLADRVWRPFADRYGLGRVFVDCVSWDVLAAIMEHEYQGCDGRPAWFLPLLKVYCAGHFPCGWSGEWPTGRLWVW